MKRALLTLAAVAGLFLSVTGQVFPVKVISQAGPIANRVNIVFLPDGYTASEMNVFAADCQSLRQALLNNEPFRSYASYINFFGIEVPSIESGVSHEGQASDEPVYSAIKGNKNTYFGVFMDCSGIHRLMCLSNNKAVYSVLADNLPEYDLAVVVSNTGEFGGGGGGVAVAAGHNGFAAEVAVHEIGHTFATLADEYWAGKNYAIEKPNMTRNANPASIKWRNWLEGGAGIHSHQVDGSWKKPANGTCKMEVLGAPFCSVCQEAIVDRIMTLVSPVDYTTPSVNQYLELGEITTLRLALVQPSKRTLRIRWSINGNEISGNADTLRLTPVMLGYQEGYVSVTVMDTTALSRSTVHATTHQRSFSWSVRVTAVCGVNKSVRNGRWDDASVWSCGHAPQVGEPVQVNHLIEFTTLPLTQKLEFTKGGILRYALPIKTSPLAREAVDH